MDGTLQVFITFLEDHGHSSISILCFSLLCKLAVSPFDCLAQPAVGADGRKGEAKGNVLLASNENMQYAVTVYVLKTVSKIVNTI
jgi:hypothetical protein